MATLTNKLWAIGILGASTVYGVSVMFGHVPGLTSDIGTFERIARLTLMAVERWGHVLTGIGFIAAGVILAILCLISGEGSPDAGLGID